MNKLVEKNDIPDNWTVTTLGKIAEYVTSGSRNWSKYYANDGALFVRTQDIKNNRLANDGIPRVSLPEKVEGKRTRIFKGDILITITGYLGRVASIYTDIEEAYVSQSVALVRLIKPEYSKFIQYQLLEKSDGKTQLEVMGYGLGRPVLNLTNIKDVKIIIAPPDQQKRIVAEIEKQFSRLDEAVSNLKRVKANLKRYKAAVLKAAVEGKLTEEWRKANPDVEPADKLLERILTERRKKWEENELAKMNAKGRMPKDDKWKTKYKEPEPPGSVDYELPKTWTSATVQQLAERVQYGSSSKSNEDNNGIPVLRMGNIFEGEVLLDKLKYLPENHDEFPELLLEDNDLLFNRTNSPELVGKTTVYKKKPYPCSFASYLIRVRFLSGMEPKFVSYYINSMYGRKWIKSVVSQQVGQANVNGTKLQALTVPLPSLNEQEVIIEEMDDRFSLISNLENNVNNNLLRAERLRQSILKEAFSGKLVNYDIEKIDEHMEALG